MNNNNNNKDLYNLSNSMIHGAKIGAGIFALYGTSLCFWKTAKLAINNVTARPLILPTFALACATTMPFFLIKGGIYGGTIGFGYKLYKIRNDIELTNPEIQNSELNFDNSNSLKRSGLSAANIAL